MIVRATSDLHLSQHTAPYVWEALEALRVDAEADGGLTVLCGDVFEQGLTAHMPLWNRLRDLLLHWPGAGVNVIVGNHDYCYSGPRNILEGMAAPSVRIVSDPTNTKALGLLVPYCKPHEFAAAIARARAALPLSAVPFLWCHHGFKGAYVNAMIRDKDGIAYGEIPDGYMAISGHYHMPQNIARLIYCGSPYELTFHEEGQQKGWLRWDNFPDDLLPTRVPFDLSAPRHHTVRWDPKQGPPTPPIGKRDHDIVRVVAEATREEVKAASKQLENAGLEAAPIMVLPNEGGERHVVNPFMGLAEVVQRYAWDRYATVTTGPEPEDMRAWAERVDLWAGI